MKKITISQTRQVKQFEPRKVEIEIEVNDNEDWEKITRDTITEINYLLYPENKQYLTTNELNTLLEIVKNLPGDDMNELKQVIKKEEELREEKTKNSEVPF